MGWDCCKGMYCWRYILIGNIYCIYVCALYCNDCVAFVWLSLGKGSECLRVRYHRSGSVTLLPSVRSLETFQKGSKE
jgi:hypothetical protein